MSDDESAGETAVDGVAGRARAAAPEHARYRPVREIARGGMGRVFEAFDHRLSRTVALKEILDTHPEARARFEREVEITARLEHPSIVPLYDAGTSADGAPFYVMRRVAGEPLDTLIRNATSLDQRLRLLPHVLALADAVAHAHARGVIHRDLKPTNVLVGELGETVVIDWGLAKLIGESDPPLPERAAGESLHTRAGTVFGTPGFMPPEQVAGESVDERADVFALGGCLYHVLAGRRPLETGVDFAIDGAPTDLITIASKAMAADKAQRYLDAGGFSEDLRRFLGGRLVAAHHYPLHARIGRWLRKHRALVAVIALALAISIGGGVLALRRIFAEQARAEDALLREVARNDDLLIYKASTYLDTDPTLAAASLQQLRDGSPRWDTLGPMIAELRARGVAYAYPSISGVRSTELMPGDGKLLLVAGTGIVRVIDLATRTTRTLAEDPAIRTAHWFGDKIGVIYRGRPTALIDVATGQATPLDVDVSTAADDGTLIGIGADRRAFVRKPDGQQFPIDVTSPGSLEVSPSGRWLAVTTRTGYGLWRATATGYQRVIAEEVADATIDFDGDRHAVVGSPREIVDYDLATATVAHRWDTPAPGLARYIAGRVHWWSANQVQRIADGLPASKAFGVVPETTTGDRYARLIDGRQIVVTDGIQYVLHAPEPVDTLVGKPGSPYLIAVGAARLFVWDLREITAKTQAAPPIGGVMFIGADAVIGVAAVHLSVTQFQLTAGLELRERKTDRTSPFVELLGAPHGNLLAIEDGRVRILAPARVPIDVADLRTVHAFGDAVVAGTATGSVVRIDRTTGRAIETIGSTGFPIARVATRDGWTLADAEDGRLWRRDPHGQITTARVAGLLTPRFGPDGTVFLGRDRELLAWEPAGTPTVVATLPEPLVDPSIIKVTARYVIVVTASQVSKYDRTTRATSSLVIAARAIAVAADADSAAVTVDGGLVILDLASGDRYRLADRIEVTLDGLTMSPDGTTVLAVTGLEEQRATVNAWHLIRGSRAWLSQATNAIPPPIAGGTITYR